MVAGAGRSHAYSGTHHAPRRRTRTHAAHRIRPAGGARCRPGGAKRANDPRGTGLPANARLYDNGWLAVRPRYHEMPAATLQAELATMRSAELATAGDRLMVRIVVGDAIS